MLPAAAGLRRPLPRNRPAGGREAGRRGTLAAYHAQGQTRLVQDFSAVRATHNDVLQAHAPAARQVDARLHAEGHSRAERSGVAGHDVWILVDLETDAVANPMREVVTVAGSRDDPARRGVDTFSRNAGADGRRRLGLRRPDQLVDAPEFGLGLDASLTGDPDGSGGVAQVDRKSTRL